MCMLPAGMGPLMLTATNSGYTCEDPNKLLAASRNFLLCKISSAPSTSGFPAKAQSPRNHGRTDRSLHWLVTALAERDPFLGSLMVFPAYDRIRDRPEYRRLARELKFPTH